MKEILMRLLHFFVPSRRNVDANGEGDNMRVHEPQFEWPHVMHSSIPNLGPAYRVRR
jgi:hypothetical protein